MKYEGATTMARATKGGEIGINGDVYEGGQFLPNTTLPKGFNKRDMRAATRKQNIAPCVWGVAPSPELRAIFAYLAGSYGMFNHTTKTFSPFLPFIESQERNCPNFKRDEILGLIEKWNSGERWF